MFPVIPVSVILLASVVVVVAAGISCVAPDIIPVILIVKTLSVAQHCSAAFFIVRKVVDLNISETLLPAADALRGKMLRQTLHMTDADGIGFPDGPGLVSRGDGGNAVVTFASPICNGPGPDFAVFENPLENAQQPGFFFLELGFVEVSSDGVNYFRFPAVSLVPETPQVGGFGCVEPHLVHNFAGKYAPIYGTPFDLDELEDDPALDKDNITHVRIVDVVGNINPEYATYDSQGHVVNDPWPTPFASSGFDLDAVGVIHDRAHASVDNHEATSITLYPNPVQNTLMVKAHEVSSITVYSLTGQCVAESPSNQVDVASLQPGVYFARVVADGTVIVNKFVKK